MEYYSNKKVLTQATTLVDLEHIQLREEASSKRIHMHDPFIWNVQRADSLKQK